MQKILSIFATIILLSSLALYNESQTNNLFKQWQKQHNRFYTPDEEIYRIAVFNKNVEKINAHNANQQNSYTMGINQFTDLTEEEFQQFYLGTTTYVNTDNIVLSHNNNLQEVDWSKQLNPVKNQGQCGSDWSFSTVGAVEGFLIVKKGFKGILAEQQLVDCADAAGDGCNWGDTELAFDYITQTGLVLEKDYPYTGNKGTCQVSSGNITISGKEKQSFNEDLIKQALTNQPLSVLVDATNWQFYNAGIFVGGCQSFLQNHAAVAVGFDANGNWKVRNSWGVTWGEQGHIWLKTGNTCAIMTKAIRAI